MSRATQATRRTAARRRSEGRARVRGRRRHRRRLRDRLPAGARGAPRPRASSTSTCTSASAAAPSWPRCSRTASPPREMYDEAITPSRSPLGASADALPPRAASSCCAAPRARRGVLAEALRTSLSGDGRNWSDLVLSLFELLPAGLLDDLGDPGVPAARLPRAPEERPLRRPAARALRRGGRPRQRRGGGLRRRGHRDVPISEAVQASTALPGLYRPVRIKGRDYVDGGVNKTAHINLAIQSGADLVICINPIVPILNEHGEGRAARPPEQPRRSPRCSTRCCASCSTGAWSTGWSATRREHPEVDILLIQPTRDDMRMFSYNIMRTSARRMVAEHGYRTALAFFRRTAAQKRRLFAKHGIALATRAGPRRFPRSRPQRAVLAAHARRGSRPARVEARRASRTRPSGAARGARRSCRWIVCAHLLGEPVHEDRVLGALGPVLA